ncbi:MAG: hypothetical protein R2711_05290 [Acidimicrobiales bacterium]
MDRSRSSCSTPRRSPSPRYRRASTGGVRHLRRRFEVRDPRRLRRVRAIHRDGRHGQRLQGHPAQDRVLHGQLAVGRWQDAGIRIRRRLAPERLPNTAGNTNLYAYSLATGNYTPILRDHVPTWSTSISNNGRYVFFIAERDLVGDGGTFQVYRFDLQTKTTIRITPKRNAGEFVTSPSGNRVLYQAGSYFYLWTA